MGKSFGKLLLCLPLIAACSAPLNVGTQAGTGTPVPMVQAQNGILYDLSCLRENAQTILSSKSQESMAACAVGGPTSSTASSATTMSKLTGGAESHAYSTYYNYNYQYQYAYYPPNYYGGNQSTLNYFCGFVFGVNWGNYNYNCVYQNFNYNNTYNAAANTSACSSCYYVSGYSQSSCLSSCWQNTSQYGAGYNSGYSYYY